MNTIKKVYFTASILAFYRYPVLCLFGLLGQQALAIISNSVQKLENSLSYNILAILGEIQLFLNLSLLSQMLKIDNEIKSEDESKIISQSKVETKIMLGWFVIAFFLVQIFCVCIHSLIQIVPVII